MMLKYLALVALIFCCAQGMAGSQDSGWVKVAPVGGGFSVFMPAKPSEEVQPGDDLTTHLFSVTTGKALYLVAYGDYAPRIQLNVDDELASNRDKFLKGVGATLTTTKQLTVEGRRGIEFTGESAQASFKSRIFIFGTRFHQIAVAVFKGDDDTQDSSRFFSSFEFSKPEARPKP